MFRTWLTIGASLAVSVWSGSVLAQREPPGGWRDTPGYQYGRRWCGWGNNASVRTREECRNCCSNRARRGFYDDREIDNCKRFCAQMIEI